MILGSLLVPLGAKAQTDAGPELRRLVAAASPGTIVRIAPGRYWIGADRNGIGIEIPSGVTVDARGATIQLLANGLANYSIVRFAGVNSHLLGGTIIGDRQDHRGTAGEWGMCISVRGAAQVSIKNVVAVNCWGDGIYVGERGGLPSRDVTIRNVELSNNRRNNISLVAVDGFDISSSRAARAGGTDPQAGIVLEPNVGTTVANGVLRNIEVVGNAGRGVVIGGSKGVVKGIRIESVRAAENQGAGFWLQSFEGVRATGLVSEANGAPGLVLLRARQFSLVGYSGIGNTGSDVSVDRSEQVELSKMTIGRQPVDMNSRAVSVQRSSTVTVK